MKKWWFFFFYVHEKLRFSEKKKQIKKITYKVWVSILKKSWIYRLIIIKGIIRGINIISQQQLQNE